jgi:hypothetical protein
MVVLTVMGSVVDLNHVNGPIIAWEPRLDPLVGHRVL